LTLLSTFRHIGPALLPVSSVRKGHEKRDHNMEKTGKQVKDMTKTDAPAKNEAMKD